VDKRAPAAKSTAKAASAPRARPSRAAQRKALAHLTAADPVLAQLIATVGPLPDARDGRPDANDHYGALLRSIVGQQLSVLAARAIYGRLRSLAEHVVSGELELDLLDALADEEVISELIAVKGLGLWSAQMFLMFHLERPDVLPVGDLGIRRAIERAYELPELPLPAQMEQIAEPWRPYRTLACRYLWRSLQNEPG
jgi:DNA-3-methyladenine glycosylase II